MIKRGPQDERWVTPPEVFTPLHHEFNFDLDAAADEETKRLPRWIGQERNALADAPWPGLRCWINPPYGHKLPSFVRAAARQAGVYGKLVVSLIPLRCRGAWWHEAVLGKATEIRCIRKRVHFLRPDGTRAEHGAGHDSCVVIWLPGALGNPRITSWNQLPTADKEAGL